jgi:hypothetical protein
MRLVSLFHFLPIQSQVHIQSQDSDNRECSGYRFGRQRPLVCDLCSFYSEYNRSLCLEIQALTDGSERSTKRQRFICLLYSLTVDRAVVYPNFVLYFLLLLWYSNCWRRSISSTGSTGIVSNLSCWWYITIAIGSEHSSFIVVSKIKFKGSKLD